MNFLPLLFCYVAIICPFGAVLILVLVGLVIAEFCCVPEFWDEFTEL